MREIKFRGRTLDGDEWQYGDLITDIDVDGNIRRAWIHNRLSHISGPGYPLASLLVMCEVDPKTVGQFTGLLDKNGKEIYEGDRCRVMQADGHTINAVVVFVDGCFELHFVSPVIIDGLYRDRDYLKCSIVNHAVEVIGNIHENPELLN